MGRLVGLILLGACDESPGVAPVSGLSSLGPWVLRLGGAWVLGLQTGTYNWTVAFNTLARLFPGRLPLC